MNFVWNENENGNKIALRANINGIKSRDTHKTECKESEQQQHTTKNGWSELFACDVFFF